MLCADADAASADLASGALACPLCGAGRLRPWGHGRERVIRLRQAWLSPRRGRCGACTATHILLPSWMASRRANAVGVIAAAAVASALRGTGTARTWASRPIPCAAGCAVSESARARCAVLATEFALVSGN